jgi:hypothetical protein
MARDLPYLASVKRLPDILRKMKAAQTPPKFTHDFLANNLGFKGSGDRPIIQVLKSLGFLSTNSIPTSRYNEFRAEPDQSHAMAVGLREGWEDVFLGDVNAHQRSASELKLMFKNVTGKSEAVAEKMATTFKALTNYADWKAPVAPEPTPDTADAQPGPGEAAAGPAMPVPPGAMRLHNDIHIHLPPTSDVSVYTAIFRALREELID